MTYCRICKSKNLSIITNYHQNAFAGSLLTKKQIKSEKKFGLKLILCNKCYHPQINNLIDPKILFNKYFWETGVTKSNIKLINDLILDIKKFFDKDFLIKIFEIASNDGSCLALIKKKIKSKVIGIDPAKNISIKANKEGILTINKFFSEKYSRLILSKYGNFNVCIARNVIAHVHNPLDIFLGVKKILSKEGVFILEFPHLLNIYKSLQYDNVFHEHVGYHSLKSIIDICNLVGMKVIAAKKINSQGGSLRVFITLNIKKKQNRNVTNILKEEKNSGIFIKKNWKNFNKRVVENKVLLDKLLHKLKIQNKKISVYGASGKGQTLLQFLDKSNKIFDKVYDKSKLKQNLYTPGTHLIIEDPKKINLDGPDYILVCTWNIIEEIIKENKKFISNGGRFIIPFPVPKIL